MVLRRLYLLLLGSALTLALWALQASPYMNVADDTGRYLVLGESLARTGQMRLLNEAHLPQDTLYPPGYPAWIAFWLQVTGRSPAGIVLLIKTTQALLLVVLLPLVLSLLERARLPRGYAAAALLTTALCPTLIYYANDIMSEVPCLFLCVAAVALVERDARLTPKRDSPPVWKRVLALVCAAAAFLTRTAGGPLLVALTVAFWKRFGWRWGLAALLATVLTIGGWQARNAWVMESAPPDVHYTSYLDQLTLNDPGALHAGRLPLNAIGLWERVRSGVPAYILMIPRAIVLMLSAPGTVWATIFAVIAVLALPLIVIGFVLGWRRGLLLSGSFTALFWLQAALWPWQNPRFLLPILPFLLLYLFLGIAEVSAWMQRVFGRVPAAVLPCLMLALLLSYFLQVHADLIRRERHSPPGYAFGHDPAEAGFYAACDWLRKHAPPGSVVMGRPTYVLYLYTGHPTTQIEPDTRPRAQEMLYVRKRHVRYLVEDAWWWAHSERYLHPYLCAYRQQWRLAWQDPHGSGVRVWQRKSRL